MWMAPAQQGGVVIFSQLLSSTANRSHHFRGSFTHPAHVLFGGGRWRHEMKFITKRLAAAAAAVLQ